MKACFSHRGNISVNIPGLIISQEDPTLACSPDGIVDCKNVVNFSGNKKLNVYISI